MLPTNFSEAEINGQTSHARRAYRPMSYAVKTKTAPDGVHKYSSAFILYVCRNLLFHRRWKNFAEKLKKICRTIFLMYLCNPIREMSSFTTSQTKYFTAGTMRSATQLPPERQGLDEVYFAAGTRRTSEDGWSYLPVMTDRRCAVQRSYRPKETSIRELSSVGSERLPYKQRVGGSTPSGIFGHPQTSFFERLYPSKPPTPLSRRISLFPVAVIS